MPDIRIDNQSVTQITVIEPEPGKQAEALSLMTERARFIGRASLASSQSACIAASMRQWQNRDLLQSAHRSPEFRQEWGHFDELTDEIDPHLYEVAHVMESDQQAAVRM